MSEEETAMDNTYEYLKFIGAGLAAVLTFMFGGFDTILAVLLAMIAIDYVSGLLGAIYTGTLSSEVGYKGIIKKVGMLLVVAAGHILGRAMGAYEIRSMVIGFYITNEAISILENWGKVGLPLPKQIKDALSRLKDGGL